MSKDTTHNRQPYRRPVTEEALFKAGKEIVVKFIEAGRVTPANFEATFRMVHATLVDTVKTTDEERDHA